MPDAAMEDAYAVDARPSFDAGRDAYAADAYADDTFAADAYADDAYADDAYVEPDARFDCSTCAPAAPCEVLTCVDACVYEVAPDGMSCGASSVCVHGGCEERRCGDGWRELGDSELAVEACDDGNTADGDGCSATCTLQIRSLQASSFTEPLDAATTAPAAGFDDEGNLLVTWVYRGTSGASRAELRGQRFDPSGAAIDAAPLTFATSIVGEIPEPTVAGLASGWVVASGRRPTSSTAEVDYWIVPTTGAWPASRAAATSTTVFSAVAAIRTDDGFTLVYRLANFRTSEWRYDVFVRRFSATGTALGSQVTISPPATVNSNVVAVGRGGNDLAVVWSTSTGLLQLVDVSGSSVTSTRDVLNGYPQAAAAFPGGVVIAANQAGGDSAHILVRTVLDGETPVVGEGVLDLGTDESDENVALAAYDDGSWLAGWVRSRWDTLAATSSDGAALPYGFDQWASSTGAYDQSIGRGTRASDGWVVTWAINSVATGYQIRVLRLVP